ncbi:ubiquitin-conjugating enzyme E2 Q2-like [Paramacrobiotus metropolitanus]|uniref:ubiquitin-conjugating enzyme E2 Q2-like n=1 Tax=Paramacrobiotus metropolitanus TaxID=2943436 RepID=UPI002445C758|nr:ubiquitin-conjugating enzyme E2 Q2-like [Paramacrobiotus metropolitanus]XP_055338086.1 ubiquitin-conjugating enzyme E2 Q2-like [Paramacrobiotus metropolitanus]XP_055338087.1 ubiquitin-conjugating enzyme E2 Q2-like [Paramacrobiotus metropolitanus]
MNTQKLKDDLKKLESFFPRDHPVFQVRSANIDEIHLRFISSKGPAYDIHGNIMETYPRSAPLWSSDSDNAQITGILEALSNTTGSTNYIFPQMLDMVTSLCSLFGSELPAESELLKVICESEYGGVDAEPENESIDEGGNEMDGMLDDLDDYPVEMNDMGAAQQPSSVTTERGDAAMEDEGIDERGQQALERVKKAIVERYSTGNPTGSVQASDRLMKELKHIYKSDNYKLGVFTVELIGDSLYDWNVKLYKVDPDSSLYTDMQSLLKKFKQDHINLNFKFADSFPFTPPFVRVVSPVISGGYVLTGGAICMELLTKQGWSSAYTVEAVIMQISATLVKGRARINFSLQAAQAYSQTRAEESFRHLVRIHEKGGWFTPPKSDG